jgi:putative ABC transport system substrate-binding protein
MNRKVCYIALSALLGFFTARVEAQQPAGKVPRIGFLDSGSASDPRNILGVEAFRQGFRELGYLEGKNINVDYKYDEGKPGRLQELAEELVRLKVDVIVTMDSGATRAAKRLTTTIPIIFTTGGSPVANGFVASLARPGGNATGVTTNSPELIGKRLELLKEALPKVTRFGFSAMRTARPMRCSRKHREPRRL